MAVFQADQNVRAQLVEELRRRGHSVYLPREPGGLGPRASDEAILRAAAEAGRIVLTADRRDFPRLHRRLPDHAGIVVVSLDRDDAAAARRINAALHDHAPLDGKLLRIFRPPGKTRVEP